MDVTEAVISAFNHKRPTDTLTLSILSADFYLITDIPVSAVCWVISNKKHQRYIGGNMETVSSSHSLSTESTYFHNVKC